nr:immunoglobulin heavy chain junction region [Mus musculus]
CARSGLGHFDVW